jgi:phosphoesterase RecJ-like protein
VEAAAFLRELPERNYFRLSLRSRKAIDVSMVAEKFGGGGHRNASGCSIEGTLADVTGRIVAQLREACSTLLTEPAAVEPPTLPSILIA